LYICLYADSVIFILDTGYRQGWINSIVPIKSGYAYNRNGGSMQFVVNLHIGLCIEHHNWVDKMEARKFIFGACDHEHMLKGVLQKYRSILLTWLNALMF
jgi:hypothetical protein